MNPISPAYLRLSRNPSGISLALTWYGRREKPDGNTCNDRSCQILFSLGKHQLALSYFLARLLHRDSRFRLCHSLNRKLLLPRRRNTSGKGFEREIAKWRKVGQRNDSEFGALL